MQHHRVYPVTILTARYCGVYEGALWLAFNDHAESLNGVQGSDLVCAAFFEEYEKHKPIGRSDDPADAYLDLVRLLDEEPHKAWPNW